ncbi:hypothetical protein RB595_004714 [Gaeumannomyces hyphopodioides]
MACRSWVNCRHAASRTGASTEYLERPAYPNKELSPPPEPNLAFQLLEANDLVAAFYVTQAAGNLDKAIDLLHRAASDKPDNHLHVANILDSCEAAIDTRFVSTGEIRSLELDLVIKVAERAVQATPKAHTWRAARLSTLSNWLGRRFEWHRKLQDIDRAVREAEEAAERVSTDTGSVSAGIWNNLGYWLVRRFEHDQDATYLDRAISAGETAVDLTPDGDALKAIRQSNLAAWLLRRCPTRRSSSRDAASAVDLAQSAVDAPGVLEADKPLLLATLGAAHAAQFASSRPPARRSVHNAVNFLQQAADLASETKHPHLAEVQLQLCEHLRKRHDTPGGSGSDADDLDSALAAAIAGWNSGPAARTATRIVLARAAASVLATKPAPDWPAASALLEQAVGLLPHVVLPTQCDATRQHWLTRFQGLGAEAAAAALAARKAPYVALNLLESGRSMTNGLMFDLDAFVEEKCPEMWEYGLRRDGLDQLVGCLAFPAEGRLWQAQTEKLQKTLEEIRALTEKVRAYPRLHSFHQLHSLEDLKAEAKEGPMVVLNATTHRCDALIVRPCGVSLLPLEGLALAEIKRRSRDLARHTRIASLLSWLWRTAAQPILQNLNLEAAVPGDGASPRVFWVLPGATSWLPMHAAGHRHGDAVIDRAMSSYSYSVKALIYGRRHARVTFGAGGPAADTALLVSMAQTAGLDDLPFAPVEVARVAAACDRFNIRAVTQDRPTYADIRAHFFTAKLFHFAGHAWPDAHHPLRSPLCLRDWEESPLTVERLGKDFRVYSHKPFLAYLSACSTGVIGEEQLVDEGIHLIGVCQQMGFRHVIGSLSPIQDEDSAGVAERVYETLGGDGITDRAVCRGLHLGLRALRDKSYSGVEETTAAEKEDRRRNGRVPGGDDSDDAGSQVPSMDEFLWVPYVHFGV